VQSSSKVSDLPGKLFNGRRGRGHELEKRGFCAPLFRSRMTKYLSISRLFLFDRSTKVAAVPVSDDKSILDSSGFTLLNSHSINDLS
jgi:hypothetical protein